MKKIKLFTILIAIFSLAITLSACKNPYQKQTESDKQLANTIAQDFDAQLNEAINQEVQKPKPIITSVTVNQLHTTYEKLPHRYNLTAQGTYQNVSLNNRPRLHYEWRINCGYFWHNRTNAGQTATAANQEIEWRYDTAGECENALAAVQIFDPGTAVTGQLFEIKLFSKDK